MERLREATEDIFINDVKGKKNIYKNKGIVVKSSMNKEILILTITREKEYYYG